MTNIPTVKALHRRSTCRLCDGDELALVLPMQPSPIADAFVAADKLDEVQALFPLDLYQCQGCGHVQNLDVVNPKLLFRNYLFRTSASKGLVEHFRRYADEVSRGCQLAPGALVVEIGSNDGTLLGFFKEKGMRVLGVDPAEDIAREASHRGLPTLPDFFSSRLAAAIRAEHGMAQLVVANNVFAHSDALADMASAVSSLLTPDGVFVFEVSYLLDIVDQFLFDTVYHEHLSYHSLAPLRGFLRHHGLQLFDVQRSASKGGSLRVFAQPVGGPRAESPRVGPMIAEEESRGLHRPEIFRSYEREILRRKAALLEFLNQARAEGKRAMGYGASTTVTTLVYHFELTGQLEYLVDDNPRKQGLFSPGCHLPVKPPQCLYDDKPELVVVLAWQYAEPIVGKHRRFLEQGGRFLVPLPELRVVDAGGQPTGEAAV